MAQEQDDRLTREPFDEPDGGWVTGSQSTLVDTVAVTLVRCEFTGEELTRRHNDAGMASDVCPGRLHRVHPDVDCASVYLHMAIASTMTVTDLAALLAEQPGSLRRPAAWAEQ